LKFFKLNSASDLRATTINGVTTIGEAMHKIAYQYLSKYIFILSTLLLFTALFVAARSFPIVEGWHEALIFFKQKGRVIYNDTEFLLPPMVYWFAELRHVFVGESFLGNRIIGLLLNIANALLFFVWLKRYFLSPAALFGSFFYLLVTLSSPAFIPRDYHNLVDFFLLLTVNAIWYIASSIEGRTYFKVASTAYILGTLIGLVFLTKQNAGFVLFVFLLFGIILFAGSARKTLSRSTILISLIGYGLGAGATIVFAAVLMFGQPDPLGFLARFILVESKGGAGQIAFRFISDPYNRKILIASIVCGSILFFIANMTEIIKLISERYRIGWLLQFGERIRIFVRPYISISLTIFAIIGIYSLGFNASTLALFAISFCVSDVMKLLFQVGKGELPRSDNVLRLFFFAGLIYSNSLTAGFNDGGTILLSTFYVAFVFNYSQEQAKYISRHWLILNTIMLSGIITFLAGKNVISKIQTPFEWWGLKEPSVLKSKENPKIPSLAGIKLSPARAEIYNEIARIISENSKPEDPIFVYPYMPVIYQFSNRIPAGKTFVQWYDFSTNKSLAADFELYIKNPPKIVVYMKIPEFVKKGHVGLIGRPLIQEIYFDYLDCMMAFGGYTKMKEWIYNDQSNFEQENLFYIVQGRELDRQELTKFNDKLNAYGLRIISAENSSLLNTQTAQIKIAGSQNNFHDFMSENEIEFTLRAVFPPYSLSILTRSGVATSETRSCTISAIDRVRRYVANLKN
jgi:hypothetical protein